MTGLYIIDDGKIYNQSPATKVFYISKKIKIAGGEIVKIPVKNTTKTQVPQATPEKPIPNNRPIGGETPFDKRRMGEASFSPLDVRVPIPEKTAPTQ